MQETVHSILNLGAPFWQYVFWGNTVYEYAVALGVLVGLVVVFKIVQVVILARLKKLADKTDTDLDDTLIRMVRCFKPPFYTFVAFVIAVQFLSFSEMVMTGIGIILVIWVTAQVTIAAQVLIDYVVRRALSEEEDEYTKTATSVLKTIAKGILWIAAVLMILSNLGVDITSLIAGLGIGGVAVALALQNILGDLFSSFAIYFDKPFVPGDFIIVGQHMGTVERIGIKTTRIRALEGEEIVISNNELTSARIQNYKHMHERRIMFQFGVLYETGTEQVREIPELVQEIVKDIKNTRFDRAHFASFDESALTFEVVYYVRTGEYVDYMDAQQEINIRLKDAFEERGIQMAYPTRTVYVQNLS